MPAFDKKNLTVRKLDQWSSLSQNAAPKQLGSSREVLTPRLLDPFFSHVVGDGWAGGKRKKTVILPPSLILIATEQLQPEEGISSYPAIN